MKDKKSSEIIQDFLDLISKSHEEYENANRKVQYYNSRTYEWTHKLEDVPNKSERNKLATAWQRELQERRFEKDRMELWEKIHIFGSDVANKAILKRLRHLVTEQKKAETYLEIPPNEREYKGNRKGSDA